MRSVGTATARAALAGNPSDGYGGGVLAVCLRDFAATVELAPGTGSVGEAGLRVEPPSCTHLVRAAAVRHAATTGCEAPPLLARVRTTIPREVGLAGSSAIVIATLRALDALLGTRLTLDDLPRVALGAEADLGISAGLQDRVAQAHGGLTAMTFPTPDTFTAHALDPALLPPLFVAWDPRGAEASGGYHTALRVRFDAGDPVLLAIMAALAGLARAAADAVEHGDADALGAALDATHDARATLGPLAPHHAALRDAAREAGLPCNSAGSGGAIVGLADDPERVAALRARLAAAGGHVVAPAA